MKFRDLPAAQFGRYGEKVVSQILKQLGMGVVPSFKFSGEHDSEAPAIEFQDQRITMPDLGVADPRGLSPNPHMQHRRSEIEVKTYAEPQHNRTHGCLVHGVPIRNIEQYVAGDLANMTDTFLGVLEVNSGALLVSNLPISKLQRYPCQCGCKSDPSQCDFRTKWGNSYPQWYFRRDSFTEWHRLDGDAHKRLQAAHAKISHALRRHGSDRESASRGVFSPQPWTWACLPCNATGTGDSSKHRCAAGDHEWRRQFWIQRLRWAMPAATQDEIGKLIARPLARTEIAKLLGDQWLNGSS